MNAPENTSPVRTWAEMVRLPAVFTILADTSAGFLLASHSLEPIGRYAFMIVGAVCLYWAGMVLNDVADYSIDRAERPSRPLPSGRISLSQARWTGWGLLVVGVVSAAISGFVPAEDLNPTRVPAAIAVVLAAVIVAYDGPLKRTPIGPALMGGCRFLSLLLGAAPVALPNDEGLLGFAPHIVGAAVGMGVYVAGITWVGRNEATGGDLGPLFVGLGVAIGGLAIVAYSPRFDPDAEYLLDPDIGFPLLIGLIGITVIQRVAAAMRDPQPPKIQAAVRHGILTLIPLSAALALLAAGAIYGLVIFLLVFPALSLAAFMRVT